MDAFSVTSKICLSNWCNTTTSNPLYEGYCLPCYAGIYPDKPVSRNYKTKERLVKAAVNEMLEKEYPHLLATFDKQISGGCSKKQPDTLIEALTHVVMGEVDENQHNTKDYCSCENRRMMELMQDVAFRPVIFVRLNPDAFTDSKGIRHPSCFEVSPAGNLIISNKKIWEARLTTYLNRLRYHLNNGVPDIELQVEHLYYNGFVI